MRVLAMAAAGLILTACEGGGDPVQQALQEEAANNHAELEFARQQQAEERAAVEAERSAEIERLRREITVAETALAAATEPDVRAAAQASLEESRQALAELDAEPDTRPAI